MLSGKGDTPKMPPEAGSAKSAAGRSRTACAACRLSRRFCDRAMPCARYDFVPASGPFDVIGDSRGSIKSASIPLPSARS